MSNKPHKKTGKMSRKQTNTQSTKETVQLQELRNCRICLQTLEQNQVSNFCKCTDQNPIHKKCLLEWMKVTVTYMDFPFLYYIHCNLCHSKIYLETSIRLNLRKWKRIDCWQSQKYCTLLTILMTIMGIFMIYGGLILLYAQNKMINQEYILLSLAVIILGTFMCIGSIIGFFYNVILQKNVQVIGIKGVHLVYDEMAYKQQIIKEKRDKKSQSQKVDQIVDQIMDNNSFVDLQVENIDDKLCN